MYCENCGKEIAEAENKITEGLSLCKKCANNITSQSMKFSDSEESTGYKRNGGNFKNVSPTDEDTYILFANMWECYLLIERIGRIACALSAIIGIAVTFLLAFTVGQAEGLSLLGINILEINSETIAVIIVVLSGLISTALWSLILYLIFHVLSLLLGGRASIIKSLKATECSLKKQI